MSTKPSSQHASLASLNKRTCALALLLLGPGLSWLSGMWEPNPTRAIRLSLDGNYAPIPSWYGPGAWLAFLVVLSNACFSTLSCATGVKAESRLHISFTLLAAASVSVFSVDLLRRSIKLIQQIGDEIPITDFPSLCAASTAVHVSMGIIEPFGGLSVIGYFGGFRDTSVRWISLIWTGVLAASCTSVAVFVYAVNRLSIPGGFDTETLFETGPYAHNMMFAMPIRVYSDRSAVEGLCLLVGASCIMHLVLRPIILTIENVIEGTCFQDSAPPQSLLAWYTTRRCYIPHRGCKCGLRTILVAWLLNIALSPIVGSAGAIAISATIHILILPCVWIFVSPFFLLATTLVIAVPQTRWFPDSGIPILDIDQSGLLMIALGITLFRILAASHILVKDNPRRPILVLPMNNLRKNSSQQGKGFVWEGHDICNG